MKTITIGIAIAVVAFVGLAFSQTTSAVQAMIALPGAGGLIAALWELTKLNVERAHRLEEKKKENAFSLSATSHMASIAFDKHVLFCEEYVAKANDGLGVLFREGPSENALGIAVELYRIRIKYILWETKDVAEFLNKFEQALRTIGANKHFLQSVGVGPERTELVKKVYATFSEIVGVDVLPEKASSDVAVSTIIEKLRDHLGITELTKLRKYFIREATKDIKS